MDYNPFTERVEKLKTKIAEATCEIDQAGQQMAWYTSFDQSRVDAALAATRIEASALTARISSVKRTRDHEAAVERQLAEQARVGLDPRRWFAADRLASARQRDAARVSIATIDAKLEELELRAGVIESRSKALLDDLAKFKGTDPDKINAVLKRLLAVRQQQDEELDELMSKWTSINKLQFGPREELSRLLTERTKLQAEVNHAIALEAELNAASNSYEKRLVHEKCERAFGGEGRPARVKQDRQRKLQGVQRNVEKLQERLKKIALHATRAIARLVIDGNNVCYEGGSFVGLAPVLALSYELASKFDVLVVFDASIRSMVRMSDAEIAHGFPREVRIHVVATKQAADQTVLEAAAAEDAYIISNDRFRDFTDKDAVRKDRLIRHEILDRKVLVHDLDVAVPY